MRDRRIPLTYIVDGRDRLTHLGSGWDEFAEANEASDLAEDRVLGQSLFSYISDDDTRHLWTLLVDRARRGGAPVEVLFRCDAPYLRRFMKLRVSCEFDRQVRFDSWTLIEEPRPSIWLLEPAAPRHEEKVRICSWCKRLEVEGDWLEVEAAVERLQLFGDIHQPRLAHCSCESCRVRVQAA